MCVWIEDADGIVMNEKSLDIVYRNTRIDSFLKSSKRLGISGIKGQGKTFLLKVKRAQSEKTDSIDCFPKNIMVDQLDSAIVINSSIKKYLEDYTKWVSLWKIAIAITIIKADIIRPRKRNHFINNAPEQIRGLYNLDNDNYRPSVYINHMLQMKRKELKAIIDYTSKLLEILQTIHHAVHIFIDKSDQAFSVDIHRILGDSKMSRGPRNASYWQYCQYALANASYDIFSNTNQHIKVYYSIRQEALIDTHDIAPNLKKNIESYIINLEYSKKDLKSMFDMYVHNENDDNLNSSDLRDSNPVKAFLGIDTINNERLSKDESAFDYIYRHSLKRPSDIMKICKHLSLDNKEIDIIKVRTTVNECSSDILNMYIAELSPFLPYDLSNLFFHINTNILDIGYIKTICNRFTNQRTVEFACTKDCINCKIAHPFSLLFNIGLLGIIKKDIENNQTVQSFNRIGDAVFLENIIQLPKSDYYFIHPCLMDVIKKARDTYGLKYSLSESYIIGDGYHYDNSSKETKEKVDETISKASFQLQKENIFISSTIDDLVKERDTIRSVLVKRGYATIMSEKDDFPIDAKILNNFHSHDYCLKTLTECGCLISIIGKKFGGEYAGENYKELCEEIRELSEGRILKPSISLMEYYLAVKKKLHHYVFIDLQYDDEEIRNELWDERVITEYKFITHIQENGKIIDNWISRYSDLDDLEMRVKNLILP